MPELAKERCFIRALVMKCSSISTMGIRTVPLSLGVFTMAPNCLRIRLRR